MNAVDRDAGDGLGAFYDDLVQHNLAPLWEVLHDLVPRQPGCRAGPALWNFSVIREHLMRSGDLISAAQAERRVLILENPNMVGESAITPLLYAGMQLVLPGEVAPCHRHAQSALRFVMEGEGGTTAVNGEKVAMRPFDLVLTPSGLWHDHANESSEPMIWLDGLDIPLLQHLSSGYAEKLDEYSHPETRPPGDTLARYGKNLRPARRVEFDDALRDQPLFHYPFSEWRESLDVIARSEAPHPHDGIRMEFTNPVTGGSVMKTLSAFCQLVPKGMDTKAKRSTDSSVFVVCSGSGSVKIGEEYFHVHEKDVFVVPAWNPLSFSADEDLVLFSFSDKAVQDRLSLWFEELF
ncbi:gentisate 1,2-dioxygenase [Parasphingorhabdus sp.]|uniref:gentisate 1,2-dioxygenase n=1 Tax=Parasphingorhabdus sp. TaxID=2709688 RepID=UPI003266DBCA